MKLAKESHNKLHRQFRLDTPKSNDSPSCVCKELHLCHLLVDASEKATPFFIGPFDAIYFYGLPLCLEKLVQNPILAVIFLPSHGRSKCDTYQG